MISLENILGRGEAAIQRNFDKLARLVIDTGGRSIGIRFGSGTFTWPGASAFSNVATVPHGLGRAPGAVFITGSSNAGLNAFPDFSVFSFGATTFAAQAGTVDAQNPLNTATTNFYWIAIG
jgi:hypothetical protein